MKMFNLINKAIIVMICFYIIGCQIPANMQQVNIRPMPVKFDNLTDSGSAASIKWAQYFTDKNLVALIDTAIKNNLEVLITLQEIEIAKNNVQAAKGRLMPSVSAGIGMGIEKVGLFTSQGAGDASADITPGNKVPEILGDQKLGFQASWEVDVWGKLHNLKKAAFSRYLSSVEVKNYVVTNLVAEVANTYYELLALDNQLQIIKETIQLQKNALEIVKVQKQASVVSELAVKQFEADVFNSQGFEYEIVQKITESENRMNFLLGRFPQNIARDKSNFIDHIPMQVRLGIPAELLAMRPDIKQAEFELAAAKCDVAAAKAEFYPSLGISSSLGFQAFKPSYLFNTPQSLAYSLLGEFAGPLVNRNAIKAAFKNANAIQVEAMYNYQKAILNGFVEVATELSNVNNLDQFYKLKTKQVESLTKSIEISNDLFKSARATYLEVLMTQRDALEAKLELVDAKKKQFSAVTNIYKALGGGWN